MPTKGNTLLSFVDLKDPYVPTGVEGEYELGPILSLLAARPFESAVLFYTPHSQEYAEATRIEAQARNHACEVQLQRLDVSDPKDYSQIMGTLGRALAPFVLQARTGLTKYSICVSSGTAEMRTAWFMLNSAGVLPATLLQLGSPAEPLFGAANVSEVSLGGSPWQTLRDLVMPLAFFESGAEEASTGEIVFSVSESATPPWSRPRAVRASSFRQEAAEPDRLELALKELGLHVGSAVTRELVERAAIAASVALPVLVTGETGSGKELIAKLIHRMSDRSGRPFVAVNCATIHDLAESQLFGHRKGAFTGADRDHRGLFEQAHGGTLFLDEVGELPLKTQASLLRVLTDGVVQPLGPEKPLQVDVRVVAATNRDLEADVRAGLFREDLYYRLEVAVLRVSPLRERRAEIPSLAMKLLERTTQRLAKQRTFSKEALARLEGSPWPGNVRQLSNAIQRSVLFSTKPVLGPEDLVIEEAMPSKGADDLAGLPHPYEGFSLEKYLTRARRQLMLRALAAANGNQAKAAKLLDISKQAVNAFQKGLNDNPA